MSWKKTVAMQQSYHTFIYLKMLDTPVNPSSTTTNDRLTTYLELRCASLSHNERTINDEAFIQLLIHASRYMGDVDVDETKKLKSTDREVPVTVGVPVPVAEGVPVPVPVAEEVPVPVEGVPVDKTLSDNEENMSVHVKDVGSSVNKKDIEEVNAEAGDNKPVHLVEEGVKDNEEADAEDGAEQAEKNEDVGATSSGVADDSHVHPLVLSSMPSEKVKVFSNGEPIHLSDNNVQHLVIQSYDFNHEIQKGGGQITEIEEGKQIGLPKLISNANHLIRFITDSPRSVTDSSDDKTPISPETLSQLNNLNAYPHLRTLVFVNCSLPENKNILEKLEPQNNNLTLVLLGVEGYHRTTRNALEAKKIKIIDEYASDLHRAASSIFSQSNEEAYEALWHPTKHPDICRIAMRGDALAYKRYVSTPYVPPSVHLTPYQIAKLHANKSTTNWAIPSTLLLAAISYMGIKKVLRLLTRSLFPHTKLPKYVLIGTSLAAVFSAVNKGKFFDTLSKIKTDCSHSDDWDSLFEQLSKALWSAGSVVSSGLLLIAIQLGLKSSTEMDTTIDLDADDMSDNLSSEDLEDITEEVNLEATDGLNANNPDIVAALKSFKEANPQFVTLQSTVINLIKREASKWFKKPENIKAILKLTKVQKLLDKPQILLSVVFWVLKLCVVAGVVYVAFKHKNTIKEKVLERLEYNKTDNAALSKEKDDVIDDAEANDYTALSKEKDDVYNAHLTTKINDIYNLLNFPTCQNEKVEQLNIGLVCTELVGRFIWIPCKDTPDHKAPKLRLYRQSINDTGDSFYYGHLQLPNKDIEVNITCTEEMYKYCLNTYTNDEHPNKDTRFFDVCMKKARVVQYMSNVSALESRIYDFVSMLVIPLSNIAKKMLNVVRTNNPAPITYGTIEKQLTPNQTLFTKTLDTIGNTWNKFKLFEVLESGQMVSSLPLSVTLMLIEINKQARKRPTLFAGLLLLLFLTYTGVLPILMLTMGFSILMVGGASLLSSGDIEKYLDTKQWKHTLRTLLRTFYHGSSHIKAHFVEEDNSKLNVNNDSVESTKVENKDSQDPETSEPKEGTNGTSNNTLSKLFSSITKTVRTTAEATILKGKESSSEVSLDLSNDPIVICDSKTDMICPSQAQDTTDIGGANNIDGTPNKIIMLIYIHTKLTRLKKRKTVNEYLDSTKNVAHELPSGYYYVTNNGEMYAFSSDIVLLNVQDLYKFEDTEKHTFIRLRQCTNITQSRIDDTNITVSWKETEVKYPKETVNEEYTIESPNSLLWTEIDFPVFTTDESGSPPTLTINQTPKKHMGGTNAQLFTNKLSIGQSTSGCWYVGTYEKANTNQLCVSNDTRVNVDNIDGNLLSLGKGTFYSKQNNVTVLVISKETTLDVLKAQTDTVNGVQHVIVGEYEKRFGHQVPIPINDLIQCLKHVLTTYTSLETLTLFTPLDRTELFETDEIPWPQKVHVHFMDVGQPDNPWHGFVQNNDDHTDDVVIHIVPAYSKDENVEKMLNILCEHNGSLKHAECVQWEYTQHIRMLATIPPDECHSFTCDLIQGTTDFAHECTQWCKHSFQSRQLKKRLLDMFFSTSLPMGAKKYKDLQTQYEDLIEDCTNLGPLTNTCPLYSHMAYYTLKYLNHHGKSGVSLDEITCEDDKLRSLLKQDWEHPYEVAEPSVLPYKSQIYIYNPFQLYYTNLTGERILRCKLKHSIKEKTAGGKLFRSRPKYAVQLNRVNESQKHKLVGGLETYQFLFKEKIPPKERVYAYSYKQKRMYRMKCLTNRSSGSIRASKSKTGNPNSQFYGASIKDRQHDVAAPVELTVRMVLRTMADANIERWVKPNDEEDEILFFRCDNSNQINYLTVEINHPLHSSKIPLLKQLISQVNTLRAYWSKVRMKDMKEMVKSSKKHMHAKLIRTISIGQKKLLRKFLRFYCKSFFRSFSGGRLFLKIRQGIQSLFNKFGTLRKHTALLFKKSTHKKPSTGGRKKTQRRRTNSRTMRKPRH